MVRVLVVGGGIAGLTTAYLLREAGCEVLVLEAGQDVGGRARTELVEGRPVDVGAQLISGFSTQVFHLIERLGLAGDLHLVTAPGGILRNGRVHDVSTAERMVSSPLLGLVSKLKLGKLLPHLLVPREEFDLHAPWKATAWDRESVASYVRRELNEEILEYLVQPPMSALFSWSPERTSVGYFLVGLRDSLGLRLFALRRGMGSLSQALAQRVAVRLGARVERVEQVGPGRFAVGLAGGDREEGDAVVLALPAPLVAALKPPLPNGAEAFLAACTYRPNVAALLAVEGNASLPYGIHLPRRDFPVVAGVIAQSRKAPGLVPPGQEVLVVYANGEVSPRLLDREDQAVLDLYCGDLARIPVIAPLLGRLRWARLYRYPLAAPEFNVGHLHRLRAFHDGRFDGQGLYLAGDYLWGPHLEGAATSGRFAYQRVVRELGVKREAAWERGGG